jgi:predicted acylesterase/phospholipase RssA
MPAHPISVRAGARPSGAAIGIVLTGGGAFGAWEVGALQAFFDDWKERYGEDPPIRVVAGTSTGAIIAPFALLGREDVAYAAGWYTSVRQGDIIAPKLGAILPFPLFAMTTSSVYSVGYTRNPSEAHTRFYGKLVTALPDEKIQRLGRLWPDRRIAAATLDFANGCSHDFSNSVSDLPHLREGILASAMAPLALPPIPLQTDKPCGKLPGKTSHLDGGVAEVAPFRTLFELAAREPAISLTHIVVISAFPIFPGKEGDSVQKHAFPSNPKFRAIGDRMNALLSEAGASSEINLAKTALALRARGAAPEEVKAASGFFVSDPVPQLIVLAPKERLGWEAFRFVPAEMSEMYRRGYEEGMEVLTSLP